MDSSLSQAIAKTLDTRADGIGSCSTDSVYIVMRICIQDQRRRHLFRLAGCIFQKNQGMYLRTLIYRMRTFLFPPAMGCLRFSYPNSFPSNLAFHHGERRVGHCMTLVL
jgi:hypothetical protein